MAGKKWCEVCRINLPFDKKAIQEHQATRRHIQNNQKSIKYQRIKIQNQQKAAKSLLKANSLMSTANVPKAKKGSQLQKQVDDYRHDVMMSGKMAIHQLIAQRTKGMFGAPIQYPEKQDLVLAQNYIDQNQQIQANEDEQDQKFQMWKIDICEQTGKACLINRISQAKVYEPPKGYIMSEQQKQEWEETLRICEDDPDENRQQAGEIGQWEEVEDEEDYFQKHRVHQEQNYQGNNQVINQQVKKQTKIQQNLVKKEDEGNKNQWMADLREKIDNNQVDQNEVFDAMLANKFEECRTEKQKNQIMKKLIKNDVQIRSVFEQQLLKQQQNRGKSAPIGFKARKRVKPNVVFDQKDFL